MRVLCVKVRFCSSYARACGRGCDAPGGTALDGQLFGERGVLCVLRDPRNEGLVELDRVAERDTDRDELSTHMNHSNKALVT